jgi:hypothetical protein
MIMQWIIAMGMHDEQVMLLNLVCRERAAKKEGACMRLKLNRVEAIPAADIASSIEVGEREQCRWSFNSDVVSSQPHRAISDASSRLLNQVFE